MKQNNLPVSALTPQQREQMWNVLLSFYIDEGTSLYVYTGLRDLEYFTDFDGYLCFSPSNPQPVFVYEYNYANKKYPAIPGSIEQFPLYFERTQRRMARGITPLFDKHDSKGYTIPFHDAGEPTPEDAAKAAELNAIRKSPFHSTLRIVADTLTQQAQGKMVFLVDDALAPKPVFIFGKENASPEQLFRACAVAYGLRVLQEANTAAGGKTAVPTIRLALPSVVRPRTLTELPGAVRRIIPDPYIRALHLSEMAAYSIHSAEINARLRQERAEREERRARGENVPEPVVTDAERQGRKKGFERTDANWKQWAQVADLMEAAAFRRLRATAEPKVKAASTKKIPLSDLEEPEKAVLADALMRIALDGLQNFCIGVAPPYITRFDEMLLGGGLYVDEERKQMMEIKFGFPLSNGSYNQVAGFAGVPYPPSKNPSAN